MKKFAMYKEDNKDYPYLIKDSLVGLQRVSGSDILINLDEIPKETDRHQCLCLKYVRL